MSAGSLCENCAAVCCRLTVVLAPQDDIPLHFTTVTAHGLTVMARGDDGWCSALDRSHMRCSIYAQRPQICRKFVMAGSYCRSERADYNDHIARGIPLVLR